MGIAAAAAWYLYLRERTEHTETRTKGDVTRDALIAACTELRIEKAQSERTLLEQINDLRESHAVRELASLNTLEHFAKSQVEAVEELARIADALRRAYDRRDKR